MEVRAGSIVAVLGVWKLRSGTGNEQMNRRDGHAMAVEEIIYQALSLLFNVYISVTPLLRLTTTTPSRYFCLYIQCLCSAFSEKVLITVAYS